jgi:hypothetical protein
MWWHYAIGYGFSVLGGLPFIYLLTRMLWMGLGWRPNTANDELHPHLEHPIMVGLLERSLYTTSWLLGKPEFIGAWLVLKVAGQWKGWTEDRELNGRKVLGRAIFNVFLIGNGFSVAYAVVGALLIEWLRVRLFVPTIAAPSFLIVETLALWFLAKRYVI